MSRLSIATLVATAGTVIVLSAQPTLIAPWRAPDASQVSFAGKKVAALVITPNDSLRVAGEEALQRELTALRPEFRGHVSHRRRKKNCRAPIARRSGSRRPASKASSRCDRSAMRSAPSTTRASGPALPTARLWGYYGYGWGSVYIPGSVDSETIVTVETLIYSVPRNQLVWAAVSETRNPKTLQKFVVDLVKEAVKELDKQGLARNISR